MSRLSLWIIQQLPSEYVNAVDSSMETGICIYEAKNVSEINSVLYIIYTFYIYKVFAKM